MSISIAVFNKRDGFIISDTRQTVITQSGKSAALDSFGKVFQLAPQLIATAAGSSRFIRLIKFGLRGETSFEEAAKTIERVGRDYMKSPQEQIPSNHFSAAMLLGKEDNKIIGARWHTAHGFDLEYIPYPDEDPSGDAGIMSAIGASDIQKDIFESFITNMQSRKSGVPFVQLDGVVAKLICSASTRFPQINNKLQIARLETIQ